MSTVTIRDIITNSCDAARLVNRNQPIPGNIFITAYTLLQRRLDQYSNTHLLSFLQKEVDIDDVKSRLVVGEFKAKEDYNVVFLDVTTADANDYPIGTCVYDKLQKLGYQVEQVAANEKAFVPKGDGSQFFEVFPDVEVNDLHQILRCYVDYGATEYDRWVELGFVSFEDFFDRAYGTGVYSVNIKSDIEQLVLTKEPITYKRMKLVYSVPFEFDADTELNIPRQFIALFTAGLTYDLAMSFPRLGDSTTAMLKQRLDELEENVRGSSSVNKFIARDLRYNPCMTYGEFKAGTFLL